MLPKYVHVNFKFLLQISSEFVHKFDANLGLILSPFEQPVPETVDLMIK